MLRDGGSHLETCAHLTFFLIQPLPDPTFPHLTLTPPNLSSHPTLPPSKFFIETSKADLGLGDFLDGLVGPNRIRMLADGGHSDAGVRTRLEDHFVDPLPISRGPFINRPIHSTRHQLAVVSTPRDRSNLRSL